MSLRSIRDASTEIDHNRRELRAQIVKIRNAVQGTESIASLEPELTQHIKLAHKYAYDLTQAAMAIEAQVEAYAEKHGVEL